MEIVIRLLPTVGFFALIGGLTWLERVLAERAADKSQLAEAIEAFDGK